MAWTEDDCNNEAKTILEPVIDDIFPEDETADFFLDLPSSDTSKDLNPFDVRNIFSIEPMSGSLAPYEYLMANIGFKPPPNVRVKAVLLCNVDGGSTERLVLKGVMAAIRFKFDKWKIDFKRKASALVFVCGNCCFVIEQLEVQITYPTYHANTSLE